MNSETDSSDPEIEFESSIGSANSDVSRETISSISDFLSSRISSEDTDFSGGENGVQYHTFEHIVSFGIMTYDEHQRARMDWVRDHDENVEVYDPQIHPTFCDFIWELADPSPHDLCKLGLELKFGFTTVQIPPTTFREWLVPFRNHKNILVPISYDKRFEVVVLRDIDDKNFLAESSTRAILAPSHITELPH